MAVYKGKAKCSCGKRAKWKAMRGTSPVFACHDHKSQLLGLSDYVSDDSHLTEADRQTWAYGLED